MSTINVNTINPANPGSETYFLARAWVNFNGTGTIAIRADGNVSSISDIGTGLYTVYAGTEMIDANYAVTLIAVAADGGYGSAVEGTNGGAAAIKTGGYCRVNYVSDSGTHLDSADYSVVFTR